MSADYGGSMLLFAEQIASIYGDLSMAGLLIGELVLGYVFLEWRRRRTEGRE